LRKNELEFVVGTIAVGIEPGERERRSLRVGSGGRRIERRTEGKEETGVEEERPFIRI
jgi:hypothetical protein